jgi:hypothetical protein
MAAEYIGRTRGICQLVVCTSLPRDQVEARANAEDPTGIDSRWTIAEGPVECLDNPDTHKHYVLEC